jgi:hypothetical protein
MIDREHFIGGDSFNIQTCDASGTVSGNKLIALVMVERRFVPSTCTGVELDPDGSSQAFTKIASNSYGQGDRCNEISLWRLDAPVTGSQTIRATMDSYDTSIVIKMGVYDLSGAKQGGVYDYYFSPLSQRTTLDVSCSCEDDSMSLSIAGVVPHDYLVLSPTGGQTKDIIVIDEGYACGYEAEASAGTTTHSWSHDLNPSYGAILSVSTPPDPVVTDIDTDEVVDYDQTGVVLTGTDLMGGWPSDSVLEFCNNADYDSATIKVAQSINTQSDTSIDFDVIKGTLPHGTVYAFVTTSINQRNPTGFAVTLLSQPVITDIDTDERVYYNQTGVILTGERLDIATDLELCNDADYDSATIKVAQTINDQTETTIDFDAVQGALDYGVVYAFVTTSLSERNPVGFEITLLGPDPVITDVDTDEEIDYDQTGVVLTGTTFLDEGATLELCNNADYGSATIKVAQSINTQSDTSIDFDVVKGALDYGIVYAFVTTSLLQINATGFSVGLFGPRSIITDCDSDEIIDDDQTSVVVQGSNFFSTGLKVYLCNNVDFDAATVKVLQTSSFVSGSEVNFDVVMGGLSIGYSWLFVSSSFNYRNLVGFQVYVNATTPSDQIELSMECAPVEPGSVFVYASDDINSAELTDNGDGTLSGDGSGSINYDHGAIFIVLDPPYPAPGTQVLSDYVSVEGGCDCGDKCFSHKIDLVISPGSISGASEIALGDAWRRMIKKIETYVLPIYVDILIRIIEEEYSVAVPVSVILDDPSW